MRIRIPRSAYRPSYPNARKHASARCHIKCYTMYVKLRDASEKRPARTLSHTRRGSAEKGAALHETGAWRVDVRDEGLTDCLTPK